MLRLRIDQNERVFTPERYFSQCHASSLLHLPNGDVVAAWFAGSKEGADDVDIWLSFRHHDKWRAPQKIVRVPASPAWNPVLFMPDPSLNCNPIHILLFYRVGRKIRDWQSYVTESCDGGRTWNEPQPLPDGCLGPIKNKAIILSDGTWLAGSSVETKKEWYCQIERSADGGESWSVSAPLKLKKHPKGIIQPTVWESCPGVVHALMRGRGTGKIARSDSTDGGKTWCAPYLTDLPSNNSGLDLVKLPAPEDGDFAPLVLAYNPVDTDKRTPLVLALSFDNGESWQPDVVLEDQPGEYSYPAIIAAADGIAVTYTYNRKHIQYVHCSIEK